MLVFYCLEFAEPCIYFQYTIDKVKINDITIYITTRYYMISEKRITDSEYITKPMYIKIYNKLKLITVMKYIALTVIILAATGISTFVINWFFECSINVILKYSFMAIDFLDLGNYTPKSSTSSGVVIIDVFTEVIGIMLLPVYLWLMFYNLIISLWMVFGCINEVFNILTSTPTPELISLANLEDSGAI